MILGTQAGLATRRRGEPQPALAREDRSTGLSESRGAWRCAREGRGLIARTAGEGLRVARHRADVAREVERERVEPHAEMLDQPCGLDRGLLQRHEQVF